MRIAFIGLGNMGGGMAARQAAAGRAVSAYDLSAQALARAMENGCESAASVDDAVADADAVITMLPAGPQVRKVYTEHVFGKAPRTALLIDCSTIDVETARSVAGLAKREGYVFADAPVSGGTAGAEAGTLAFMVGCDEADFPGVEGVIGPMARAVIRAGDHGAGQAAKICNNMLLGISMIGACEAFALGERLGLDADRLFEIVSKSSGQCWSVSTYCPVPGPVPTSPANRGYTGGFATAMMLKDLKLAQAAAAHSGAVTPLGAQAEALFALFDRLGYGDKDFSGIIEMLRGNIESLDETRP